MIKIRRQPPKISDLSLINAWPCHSVLPWKNTRFLRYCLKGGTSCPNCIGFFYRYQFWTQIHCFFVCSDHPVVWWHFNRWQMQFPHFVGDDLDWSTLGPTMFSFCLNCLPPPHSPTPTPKFRKGQGHTPALPPPPPFWATPEGKHFLGRSSHSSWAHCAFGTVDLPYSSSALWVFSKKTCFDIY